MINKHIGTTNIEDSNLFLRKLWCELDKIEKNGWNYCPYTQNNTVFIDINNIGEIKFDYYKI